MRGLSIVLLVFVACGCGVENPLASGGGRKSAAVAPFDNPARALRTDGRFFKDRQGRSVMLRGVNVADASKWKPFLPWQTEVEYDRMVDWGVNCIRYLIIWEAIEPKPFQYDDAYLAEVKKRLDWAHARGIHVFLDMHQDVYSQRYAWDGDGAPAWACFDQGVGWNQSAPLPYGLRNNLPGCINSFDALWEDRPSNPDPTVGGDGVGVQTHLVEVWRHVAAYFRDHPAVFGYDLINEPDIGSYRWEMAKDVAVADPTLFANVTGPGDPTVMNRLKDNTRLYKMLNAMGPTLQQFERTSLMPFYNRVIEAIRSQEPTGVALIEPAIMKGSGAPAFLVPPTDSLGRRQPNIAYAPHYYDPTMQWVNPYDGNKQRSEIAYGMIEREAQLIGGPVLYGEWGGIDSGLQGAYQHIVDQMDLQDAHLANQTYWDYRRSLEKDTFLEVMRRPYPRAVAGKIVSFSFAVATKVFRMTFETDSSARGETELFVPTLHYPNGPTVTSTDPAGTWTSRYDAKRQVLFLTHDPNTKSHAVEIR